jgi:D-alanyl-D-alanine carboxypeptidase
MKKILIPALLLTLTWTSLTGCNKSAATSVDPSPSPILTSTPAPTETIAPTEETTTPEPTETIAVSLEPTKSPTGTGAETDADMIAAAKAVDALPVIAVPDSISVLVNKFFALPKSYEPTDLVFPDVPFIFKEKSDKRKMRTIAARALEKLFVLHWQEFLHTVRIRLRSCCLTDMLKKMGLKRHVLTAHCRERASMRQALP